jgi:hypothetical protein
MPDATQDAGKKIDIEDLLCKHKNRRRYMESGRKQPVLGVVKSRSGFQARSGIDIDYSGMPYIG